LILHEIEKVIIINTGRDHRYPELKRKAAETGSIVLAVFVSGFLVYETNDAVLAFSFAAPLGFLFTNRLIRALRG
jgi:hypothetical protein